MNLSVILPARNEEGLIGSTLSDITKYLDKKNYLYEILVVINGCEDNTEEVAKSFSKKNSRVKIINSNPGYGVALKKGLKSAKGEYVVIFNVDYYDLHLLDLADIGMYGKDVIIGSKRTYWSQDNRSSARKAISHIFNLFLRLMFGFKGSDTHGIKILRKAVVDKTLSKCKTTSGIFDTELVLRAERLGFKMADFPVNVKEIRASRFTNKRVFQTPADIINLYKSLNER